MTLSPLEWKKGNLVSVYKKSDKQCLRNRRPISILPVCIKSLEKLIFSEMLTSFDENNIVSP